MIMNPATAPDLTRVAQVNSPSTPTTPLRLKPRLLVVEDEKAMGDIMIAYFEHLGLEVELARTAVCAQDCIEEGDFDVAVFDWKLDGGATGLDLLDLFRKFHPDCPVVIFTGAMDNLELLRNAVAGRAEAVVTKPATISALAENVMNLLLVQGSR